MNYRFATVADSPLLASMNEQLIRDEGHRNRMAVSELEERMEGWLARDYRESGCEDSDRSAGW